DCSAYQIEEQTAQGFRLNPDQASMVGDTNPNSPGGSLQPTTPPPGQGYIYIWPAVATASPQDQHPGCGGQARLPASAQPPAVAECVRCRRPGRRQMADRGWRHPECTPVGQYQPTSERRA